MKRSFEIWKGNSHVWIPMSRCSRKHFAIKKQQLALVLHLLEGTRRNSAQSTSTSWIHPAILRGNRRQGSMKWIWGTGTGCWREVAQIKRLMVPNAGLILHWHISAKWQEVWSKSIMKERGGCFKKNPWEFIIWLVKKKHD